MRLTLVILALAAASLAPGAGSDDNAFDQLVGEYEKIRLALLADSMEGVAAAADAIADLVTLLEKSVDPHDAGVAADKHEELRRLLPDIRNGATALAGAREIHEARASFGELSKALVAYRRLIPDPEPVVVYCSMAKEVWLQPRGEIGNPYYGQSMARCGEVVSD